jgi:multidrug efflux system outer membrane protein
MPPFRRLLLFAGVSASLAAAQPSWGWPTIGPKYVAPIEPPVALATSDPRVTMAEAAPPAWWRAFGDLELDALIARGLAANLDLRAALDRVGEARALFHRSRFDLFPHITNDATYTRSDEQVPGFTNSPLNIGQADLGFDATWEIDLFGRVRHEVRAARADADAAREDLRDARVLVVSEIARNYLLLRGAQARRAVAEENAGTARDTLRLTQVRFDIGTGDPVDVESARARLDATEASIPPLRSEEAEAAHRLAVLVGVRPGTLDAELSSPVPAGPAAPTSVPIGDAAQFLRQRPDVRAAERRLAAATARTGVATAELFPRINVTGFVGFLSGDVASLFRTGSHAWAISPSITWPGLDLGSHRAQLRAQVARQDQSLAAYDQAVLRAIEDLQNAVVAYRERQQEVVSLSQQVDAARRAADLAHIRYREGRIDFLRVLDAERTRLEAEDALTQAQTNANIDVVSIYKALGGGAGQGA